MFYLIVVLGDPSRPHTDHLSFESSSSAHRALDRLSSSTETVIEFENELGEVLAVRREAILKAWTSETLP